MIWNEQNISRLIHLWNVEKLSGTEIAVKMGNTRSGILGKVHRMRNEGLMLTHRDAGLAKIEVYRRRRKKLYVDKPVKGARSAVGGGIRPRSLTGCQYPIDEISAGDEWKCLAPVHARSYCEEHYKISYIREVPRWLR